MKRREFITLLGGAAAWPLAARAQQPGKVARIGFLGATFDVPERQAFLKQLRELGFSEGGNLVIEYREVDDPRGPFVAAAELMRSKPELIVAVGPEVALQAVVGASGFIPIVMLAVNFDPLARGYVNSLARPGGQPHGSGISATGIGAKASRAADAGVSGKDPIGRSVRLTIGRPVRRGRADRKVAEPAASIAEARQSAV
jgi:putative ABC transport system substrate-binding protein